mgnify:FL=1
MKKTLSVFLSFVMLFTCLCAGGISAGAVEKKSNIQYLFDRENETLYIRGKGAVPAYYLGWDECKNDDYNDKFSERDEDKSYGYMQYGPGEGDSQFVYSPKMNDEILLRSIYPSFYIDTTRYVKKIVFEKGITSIGDGAFSYAFPKLEQVVFSSTITSIGSGIFACNGENCPHSIIVPATVKSVDRYAFCEVIQGSVVFLGKSTQFVNIGPYDSLMYSAVRIYCLPGSTIEKQCKQNNASKDPYIEKVDYKVIKTPAQVSGVKAGTTGSTVKLTWNKAKYANRYKVQRYVVSQKKWKTYATVTGTSYTFKNMAGSTNYRFRVIGVNRICDADFSGKASKECKAKTKFGKVLGVKVSAKNGTLSAKWNAVREAKSYQVYYATKKDGSYKKLGTASGTSFKKKVTKGKTYYVKVRAVKKNSKGKTVYGAYSDVKSVKV